MREKAKWNQGQTYPKPLILRTWAFIPTEPRHTYLFQIVGALSPPLVHIILFSLGVYLQWPRKHGELRAMNTQLETQKDACLSGHSCQQDTAVSWTQLVDMGIDGPAHKCCHGVTARHNGKCFYSISEPL